MKRSFASLILVVNLAAGAAYAGPISSGSGNAFVCRAADNSIVSAELLDFYEARVVSNEKIGNTVATDFASNLEFGIRALSKTAYGYFSPTRDQHFDARIVSSMIMKNRVFVSAATIHRFDDNLFSIPLPNGCAIEQAAAYLDNDSVEINEEIWTKFAAIDQAGLILHETIYWFERQMGSVRDSRRARQVTAKMYDPDFKIEDVAIPLIDPHTARYVCFSGENVPGGKWVGLTRVTSLVAYTIHGQLVYQFAWVGGEPLLTRTIVEPQILPRTENQSKNETKISFNFAFAPGPQTASLIVTRFAQRTNEMWASIGGQVAGPWSTTIPLQKFECWSAGGDAGETHD